MENKSHRSFLFILILIIGSSLTAGLSQQALRADFDTIRFENQFSNYLDLLVDQYQRQWATQFEENIENNSLERHLDTIRLKFLAMLGSFPEKTSLNPQITGTVEREGYRVEKIIFESRPKHFVTALLFVPEGDSYQAPYPGVLIPSGHFLAGKGHDEYQSMGALCALSGLMALVFDPLDQGERSQFLDNEGKSKYWGTRSHNLAGIKCSLLGTELANYFVWDGIRALDYLCSRSDVDTAKLGITGNSGGATQSSYLFIADDRLKVAAPSCFIHNIFTQVKFSMGDAEQNLYGLMKEGIDHADYVMVRAPAPLKILAATHDFFKIDAVWETYRYAKRYYTQLGFSENIELLENYEGHNFNTSQREASARWLYRWLYGVEKVIEEPVIELLTPEEYMCTPAGQVMLLGGSRSIHDLFIDESDISRKIRTEFLDNNDSLAVISKIRELATIRALEDIPPLQIVRDKLTDGKGYDFHELVFRQQNGLFLPARLYIPDNPGSLTPTLLVSEYGKSAHKKKVDGLLNKGHIVLSVDLIGTGENQQRNANKGNRLSSRVEWEDVCKAHLMGRSLVGYRAEDILNCSRYLAEHYSYNGKVNLASFGEVSIPALHAAVTELALFDNIEITQTLTSWEEVMTEPWSFNQQVNVVYGALNYYNIHDLIQMLGKRITVIDPLDAHGLPLNPKHLEGKASKKPKIPGLAGVWYGRSDLSSPEGSEKVESLDIYWDKDEVKRGQDWSVGWFGYVRGPATGPVTIILETDQLGVVFVDDKEVVSVKRGELQQVGNIDMKKGHYYPLRIVYARDSDQSSYMKIKWSWDHLSPQIISVQDLMHSYQQQRKMQTVWR